MSSSAVVLCEAVSPDETLLCRVVRVESEAKKGRAKMLFYGMMAQQQQFLYEIRVPNTTSTQITGIQFVPHKYELQLHYKNTSSDGSSAGPTLLFDLATKEYVMVAHE
jgi:hypothetical protein